MASLTTNAHITDRTPVNHLPDPISIKLKRDINLTPKTGTYAFNDNLQPRVPNSDLIMGCYFVVKEMVNYDRFVKSGQKYEILFKDNFYEPLSNMDQERAYGWSPYLPRTAIQAAWTIKGSQTFSELRCIKFDETRGVNADYMVSEFNLGNLKYSLKDFFSVDVPYTTIETN